MIYILYYSFFFIKTKITHNLHITGAVLNEEFSGQAIEI